MGEEMINLSIKISDIMNYDIKIGKVITSEGFPEVMKRLRAIQSMLPKEVIMKREEPLETPQPIEQLPLPTPTVIPTIKQSSYERNKERRRAYAKRYYAEHKDEINAKAKMKSYENKMGLV